MRLVLIIALYNYPYWPLLIYLLTITILNGISLTYYDLPFPENGSQITPGQTH